MSETMTVSEDLGSEGETAPAPDTTEAAAPLSIRETLEASYEAAQGADEPAAEVEPDEPEAAPAERLRGPDGKFAAKSTSRADGEENNEGDRLDDSAPAAVPPPEGWGDKAKIDWNRLPASVKAEIASRVSAPQQADPIRAVAQEFADDIAAVGAPPETLFRSLLVAERELRTNPEAALKWLARSYNIDLSRLAPSQAAAQPAQAGEPVDPRMQAVYAEVQTLREQLNETRQLTAAQQQAALQRQQAEASQEIQTFAKDRPHFEAVRTDMALLVREGRAADLATAYDMAVWANPTTRAALIQEQRQAEQAERAKEAAARAAAARKAGSINVRSTPGSAPAVPTSMRATLESAYDHITAS